MRFHRIPRTLGGAAAAALFAAVLSFATACESPDDGSQQSERPAAERPEPASDDRPAPEIDWSEPRTVASGPGKMGPWKMNDSKFHYVDDPTIRWLPDGGLAVAFVDNQRQNVYFQKFGSDGTAAFDEPVDVSKSPEIFSWLPKIAVGGDGSTVYVLWQEIVFSGGSHGGEAFFARSTDGGTSFDTPINLSETEDGDGKGRLTREIWHNGSLDITLGPSGTIYAAWTAYEGDLWFARSTDGGERFSEPTDLAGTTSTPARGPDFAVGPDGTVHLAWTVGESDSADIRIATSADGTSFGEPRIPFETGGHSDAPKIAVGPEGTVHLAFGESPEGRFEQYTVQYARRGADASFQGTPKTVAGPGTKGAESANFPALRLDSDGEAYLVWERYPEAGERPVGLGVAHTTDDGSTLTAPTIIPGTADPDLGFNGSLQGLLMQKLDVAPDGEVAVVNSRFRRGDASRVRLYTGRPSSGE